MEFRNLKKQYEVLKEEIDKSIITVCQNANFISGTEVKTLENNLAEFSKVKHCISCANGTDALNLVLMAWGIGEGDAVFVPDFTFFATAETVALQGATPIFVDIKKDTFNICANKLEEAIKAVINKGKLTPKVIIPVDLFGLCADYVKIQEIADKYNLLVLSDSAQGYGGAIGNKKAGSFGNATTTSFFPAKPLGCYGDGGAIFTNDADTAQLLRSFAVHGKGIGGKYDNDRIGLNSRLDTIQAAILQVKLNAFKKYELEDINEKADYYTANLKDYVQTPFIPEGYFSSWAQYTLILQSEDQRNSLQAYLKENGIPTMIYYPKVMSEQKAMEKHLPHQVQDCTVAKNMCKVALSLPISPYITKEEQDTVINFIKKFKS